MKAYPLKDGRKVVAYACGVCHHPAASWTASAGWDRRCVARSQEMAEKCCACLACGRQVAPGLSIHCANEDCVAARKAAEGERAAAAAQAASDDCDTWEIMVEKHELAWRFRLDNGRVGMLYVGPARGCVFYNAFARLDPTAEEPDPPMGCTHLQRSEHASPWEALAALTHRYDTHVAFVVRVPRVLNVVEGDTYEDSTGERWRVVAAQAGTPEVELRSSQDVAWTLARDLFPSRGLRGVELMPRGGVGMPWATAPGTPRFTPVTAAEGATAHVLEAEAAARAQVAAALRGEEVPHPYLCDEVREAREVVWRLGAAQALHAEQERINADLRARLNNRHPAAAPSPAPPSDDA